MTHTVNPVPEGVHTVVPYLCLKGAAAAIDFYKRAFGATEQGARTMDSTGRVGHAEIRIGDCTIMLADEHPELGFRSPLSLGGCPVLLMLNVPDVDTMVARAVDAGGRLTRPVENQFYGSRTGEITDPFGYRWYLSTHVEDVPATELVRRAAEREKVRGGRAPSVCRTSRGGHVDDRAAARDARMPEGATMAPHDLEVLAKGLSQLTMTSVTTAEQGNTAFASTPFSKLTSFNHGGVFVGRFTGQAPWERHRHGDELVHVLDGEVDLTVMTERRPVHVTLRAGCIFVVPRGLWHRQHARTEVTLLSATPTPTDISFAADPRSDKRLEQAGGERARSRRPRPAAGRSAARSARAAPSARRRSSGRSRRRPGPG